LSTLGGIFPRFPPLSALHLTGIANEQILVTADPPALPAHFGGP
jgi:hypothetical protein